MKVVLPDTAMLNLVVQKIPSVQNNLYIPIPTYLPISKDFIKNTDTLSSSSLSLYRKLDDTVRFL